MVHDGNKDVKKMYLVLLNSNELFFLNRQIKIAVSKAIFFRL